MGLTALTNMHSRTEEMEFHQLLEHSPLVMAQLRTTDATSPTTADSGGSGWYSSSILNGFLKARKPD
jgi:hypothetical protein